MDGRIDVDQVLGLEPGEAQVLRNAGAVATADAIRSLVISQHLRGTREVIVIGHTDCGLQDLDGDLLRARLSEETGLQAEIEFGRFTDVDAHVRDQVERIAAHAWTLDVPIRGLVFDVVTGEAREVV
jgi:carbonic anhydrase